MRFPKLFEPGRVGAMEVKNRIIASPMERNYCTAEGRVTAVDDTGLTLDTLGRAATALGLRVHLDDETGFDLTEAGTRKRLAVYVVKDPASVPGVARLGVDPLSAEFTAEKLASLTPIGSSRSWRPKM